MRPRKYTEEQLRMAVSNSTTLRQVLAELGLVEAGGNYICIKRAIQHYQVDTQHFLGKASNRGRIFGKKRETAAYLAGEYQITTWRLKQRLIEEGFLTAQCSRCENTEWLGEPIPLELDHIDGDRQNNALENLRVLCPNCHALTPTYRGKNQKRCKSLKKKS
jgi:5-methylcytosine-specific restriction endonuclease McrA